MARAESITFEEFRTRFSTARFSIALLLSASPWGRGPVKGVYAGESLPHASVCQILQIVALRGEQLIAAAHQSHISSADEITLHIRGLLA